MLRGRKAVRFFPMEKACNACSEVKALTEYHIDRQAPDGHRNTCKDCVSIRGKEYKRRRALPKEIKPTPISFSVSHMLKLCSRCSEMKDFSEYYKTKDGKLTSYCKQCIREYQAVWKKKKRKKVRGQKEERRPVTAFSCVEELLACLAPYVEVVQVDVAGENITEVLKCCSRCKEVKSVSEYYKSTHQKDGFSNWCKTCTSEYAKARVRKSRELGSENRRRYEEITKDRKNKSLTGIKKILSSVCAFISEGFTSYVHRDDLGCI